MGGVDLVAQWLGWMDIWILFIVTGLNEYLDFTSGGWVNGYLGGLMMEASCLMIVVEWIDDGGWVGCVGSLKEMIV